MIASQKKLAMAESQISFGLQYTCIKNSITLYGTEIRRNHTMNYRNAFERICRLARNCDIDDIIHDALMQSALGLLYQRMIKYDPDRAVPAPSQ
jgi:hypothetical protein